MNFEIPTPKPEDFEPENGRNIILTEQEAADFAEVKDRIWAKIVEEITRSDNS